MPSRDHGRGYRRRLKYAVLTAYASDTTPSCRKCGSSNIDELQIDHVNGGGDVHRIEVLGRPAGGHPFYLWLKRNGYPTGYQILCRSCNINKRDTTDKQAVKNANQEFG